MGSASPQIGLDLNLCAVAEISFVKEAAAAGDGSVAKLEASLRRLEEEMIKIEVFKRELPLCMLLLTDVIEVLKEELGRRQEERFARGFKEFIPIRSECVEGDCEDKAHSASSSQIWCASSRSNRVDDGGVRDKSITNEVQKGSGRPDRVVKENVCLEFKIHDNIGGGFFPFSGLSPLAMSSNEEAKPTEMLPVPDRSLPSTAVKDAAPTAHVHADRYFGTERLGGVPRATAGSQRSMQQPPRKTRRCWSPEMHRLFVLALEQLGGAQVATPKQIREVMKLDGLTNDEVKSHLQKYRLHSRKIPDGSATANRPVVVFEGLWMPPENNTSSSPPHTVSQSGSPQSPLQFAGSNLAISVTAGDSCQEDDGKSESFNWRS
ncbi:transcription factor NIGTH1-like [Curcuma longa]|uniref:transcription factor NIGTH1-like n=1 Tax=Curcuma longa TaxID=136217 RepID=UPI003D9F6F37